MLSPRVPLEPEGIPYIAMFGFSCLIFTILDCWFMSMVLLVLTIFAMHFFRDPERVQPDDPDAVVSPADGKVVKIEQATDPISGETRTVVCVVMNVFNVHVNRMPVSGTIKKILYIPGKFFNASLDKASKDNERCVYEFVGQGNKRFTMVQIAGLVARRIVCRVEKGDKLKRGQRFGVIRFGSRLDLYLPDGYDTCVTVGNKVVAGETPLAQKTAN